MDISNDERLNLKKMAGEMGYQDNTDNIRRLKHSVKIRDNIIRIEALKTEFSELRNQSPEQFFNIVHAECEFLYDNYMDIFTRVMKDEIDVVIMQKFLIVLKLIEDGQLDQEQGSIMIGRQLKDLYLDSAVRHADNLDKEREAENVAPVEGKNISWKDFKRGNLSSTLNA
jgi:hypothetical protein